MNGKESKAPKLFPGLLLLLVILYARKSASSTYIVSDVLFFFGIWLLMTAASRVIGNTGLFDIVIYSTQLMASIVTNKPLKDGTEKQSFAEFAQQKRKPCNVNLMVFSGCLCLLASMLAAAIALDAI